MPGASGPGEPGYEGDVTVGEESVQYSDDPFGRPEPPDDEHDARETP